MTVRKLRPRGYCIGSEPLRAQGNNSRPLVLKGRACAGMSLISMRSSLYVVSFWNVPGPRIGMRKPSLPPNHQKFDMHPLRATLSQLGRDLSGEP